jgi:hypothetical protein
MKYLLAAPEQGKSFAARALCNKTFRSRSFSFSPQLYHPTRHFLSIWRAADLLPLRFRQSRRVRCIDWER